VEPRGFEPLPSAVQKGGKIDCQRFLEFAKFLQMAIFLQEVFAPVFRIFTRVAARLLHTTRRMLEVSGSRFQGLAKVK
jgi:hypothetical protein